MTRASEPSAERVSLILTSTLVIGAGCVNDIVIAAQSPHAWVLAALACLVLALGPLHGALFELAVARSARLSTRVAAAGWVVLASLAALGLALSLGAFEALGGHYHLLAVATLIACAIGGPAFGVLLFAFAPCRAWPHGFFAQLGPRARPAAGLALIALGCGSFLADRSVLVGLYPEAHLALRLAFLWLASMGGALLVRRAWLREGRVTAWLLPCGLALFGLGLGFGEQAGDELSTLGMRPWPRLVLQTARTLTDVDFDGHSHLLGGGDCALLDPAIHPSAPEIPGNGIDDNCLLGDGALEHVRRQRLRPPKEPSPMDVVLITIDSLRRDRVGLYSPLCGAQGAATTPELDAFGAKAMVFERAYTTGGWTSIAISSLMRGVLPRRMQWTRMYETNKYRFVRSSERSRMQLREVVTKMFPMPLGDPHPTLAGWLSQRGLRTMAVVDDGYSDVLSPATAVAPDFQVYRIAGADAASRRGDTGTTQLALATLASVPAGSRFFLWVHYFGTHTPDTLHAGVRLDGAGVLPRYDHEIRFVDRNVGKLLHALEERDQPTAIFITADHGEELVIGGRHHGWSVAEEAIAVPFVARVPGWPAGRNATPVSLVDLMPTIFDLTRTPAPDGLDGRSLRDVVERKRAKPRFLFADTWQYDRAGNLRASEVAALDDRGKATFDALENAWSFYDLRRDPPLRVGASRHTNLPAVSALAHYIESTGGEIRLRD